MTPLLYICRTTFPSFNLGGELLGFGLLNISQDRPLVENTERNSDPAAE